MKWNILIHPKAVKEISGLPIDMRAKLTRLLEIVEQVGPMALKEPHVKNLGNKLMEIRLTGKDGIARVIYAVFTQKRVTLLHSLYKENAENTKEKSAMCVETIGGSDMKSWEKFEDIKAKWLKDPEFKKAYDDLEIEYDIALALIKARTKAGLTQDEVASLMGTTQSVIARLESGKTLPSVKTLAKYAKATGSHLHVSFS
jgi:phage-related protein/DNA-binding XRE family transcriptional regulator